MYPVNYVARETHRVNETSFTRARRVLRYMTKDSSQGLTYDRDAMRLYSKLISSLIVMFGDSSYSDTTLRKSTGAIMIFYKGSLVSWTSSASKTVMLSTKESETDIFAKGVCRAIQIRGVLEELGIEGASQPMPAFCDNQSALDSVIGERINNGSKHYQNKVAWLRDMMLMGVFTPHYVSTTEMVADLNTKAHFKDVFERLTSLINGNNVRALIQIIEERSGIRYVGKTIKAKLLAMIGVI
jgi:hypothetical protein